MSDGERLNKLEAFIWSKNVGNGIVIWPTRNFQTGKKSVSFQDLGDEDGSNLGEELTDLKTTLRDAIDAL